MKSLKHFLNREFEKEGFFIPSLPRAIDTKAIETATQAVIEYLLQFKTGAAQPQSLMWQSGYRSAVFEVTESLKKELEEISSSGGN